MTTAAIALDARYHQRIQKIQVQGITIMTLDFSQATSGETLAMLDDFRSAFDGLKPHSIRLLTDVSNFIYDSAVSSKWKVVRMEMDPFIKASAIYGVDGLLGVAIRSYTELMVWLNLPSAKTKLQVFKTREKALAWLLEQ